MSPTPKHIDDAKNKDKLPEVPLRQPKPKSIEDKTLPANMPVSAIKSKNTNSTKSTVLESANKRNQTIPLTNNSFLLNDATWHEIRDILRPGLPFNSKSKNASGYSTMPYTPNPHEALMVLSVCMSVLFLSLAILGCKYWCENRRRNGYSPAPKNPPDYPRDVDDVIEEVKNRREPTPAKLAKSQISNSAQMQIGTPYQSKHTLNHPSATNSKSRSNNVFNGPSNLSNNQSNHKGQEMKHDVIERKSEPSLLNHTLSSNVSRSNSNPTPVTCPLNEPKPLKLIPVENLVIPRTFSDAIKQAYPDMANHSIHVDIDKVLSLSKVEKSQSHANLILKPIPSVSKMDNISFEPDIQDGQMFTSPPVLSIPTSLRRDFLTPQQNDEERLKFLRACWKNEMRRRRSLCSITNNQDLVDPELYNSIIWGARKVKSMPTMVIKPFGKITTHKTVTAMTYSTDALSDSPIWSPPAMAPGSGQRSSNLSRSSSVASFKDDWNNITKTVSYSTKVFSVPQETTVNTSGTSIWSTVASENAVEQLDPFSDMEDDFQDSKIVEVNKINTMLPITISEDDDEPGDTLSPQILASVPNIERKRSVTALDFIMKSIKSIGYIPKEEDSIQSITLESDKLPSEIFTQSRKLPSTDSLLGEESVSNLFNQGPHSFWDRSVIREYQVASGAGSTIHQGASFHNKIEPNNLRNSRK